MLLGQSSRSLETKVLFTKACPLTSSSYGDAYRKFLGKCAGNFRRANIPRYRDIDDRDTTGLSSFLWLPGLAYRDLLEMRV